MTMKRFAEALVLPRTLFVPRAAMACWDADEAKSASEGCRCNVRNPIYFKFEAMTREMSGASHDGQKYASPLYYALLPAQVIALEEKQLKQIEVAPK